MNARTLHAADGRPVFTPYPWGTGLLDTLDRQFPSTLHAWDHRQAKMGEPLALELGHQDSTFFGYADRGPAAVHWKPPYDPADPTLHPATGYTFRVEQGQYFVFPGMVRVSGGRGILVEREHYQALPLIGGPLERMGRLKYIDGCTDSLLASPVRKGDPCLNLLYFPPGIDQTAHTHPSDRIGMILSGRGLCVVGDQQASIDLTPGMIFCIHTDGLHRFATPYGEELRVLAYHPDSDFGPTDAEHPMINRTIVEGVPASQLDAIHTR